MDVWANLGVSCLHMTEDKFSHGAAQVFIRENKVSYFM